jgi:hypothetical protein
LVGCGKPIKDNKASSEPTVYQSSFTLRALRSFNPAYNWDGIFQTREIGWYDVPTVIKSTRSNHRPGWVHIEHDSFKFCYKSEGNVDYDYDHYRTSGECADPEGREDHGRTQFFVTWRVPVYLRIENNCLGELCRTIEVDVTILKHVL